MENPQHTVFVNEIQAIQKRHNDHKKTTLVYNRTDLHVNVSSLQNYKWPTSQQVWSGYVHKYLSANLTV